MQPIVVPAVIGILWTVGFFYLLYLLGEGWKRETKYKRRIRELEKRLDAYEPSNSCFKSSQSISAKNAAMSSPTITLNGDGISGRTLS